MRRCDERVGSRSSIALPPCDEGELEGVVGVEATLRAGEANGLLTQKPCEMRREGGGEEVRWRGVVVERSGGDEWWRGGGEVERGGGDI